MFKLSTISFIVMAVLLSVNGAAGEGVLEINQTCAVNGGVGILLFNGSSILTDSAVTGNTSFGVECSFGGDSGLDNVVLNFNNSNNNQWDGTCTDLGGNLCQGSTTCP